MQLLNPEKRRHTGQMVQSLFEVLLNHPEGLAISGILEQMHADAPINGEGERLFMELMRGCVAAIKADWLRSDGYYLTVSEKGKLAYEHYSDPVEFIEAAGKLSARGWISINFPRPYFFLGKLTDQFTSELRVARRIGIRHLLGKALGAASAWQEILPIQSPRRIRIPNLDLANLDSLLNQLRARGLPFSEGGNAIYLPPETLNGSAFHVLADDYPPNSGVKIIKHRGGISESVYVTRPSESRLHLRLVHNLRHLTLVANLLYGNGVGPRLHDLVELQCNEHLWTAFVMDHVGSSVCSKFECEEGIRKIRELERRGLIKVILPAGFEDAEFECPTCAGNAFRTDNGEFRYVDFQNFALINYDSFLRTIAIEASEASHFGDKSILRGGRYLYQSVPGVNLPGKRSVDARIKVLEQLTEMSGVSVRDRLVLDVGCNIGMMMAQYLKLGALWCHGWDRGSITPHAEKLLLALGCTRFSISATDINKSRRLEDDLALCLKPHLEGCVISYLAVRGHLDWLDSLARIPWSFLIYEGHEGEGSEHFDRHIAELRKLTNIKVAAVSDYSDGDSEPRTAAILLRN